MKRYIVVISVGLLSIVAACNSKQETVVASSDPVINQGTCSLREVKNVTFKLNQRGRVDWSHANNLIAFDKRGKDKYYDVYNFLYTYRKFH